jgi:hypothetical protein
MGFYEASGNLSAQKWIYIRMKLYGQWTPANCNSGLY